MLQCWFKSSSVSLRLHNSLQRASFCFWHIGTMGVVCNHYGTLKFVGETPGFCCPGGKVKLPPLPRHQGHCILWFVVKHQNQVIFNTQKYNGESIRWNGFSSSRYYWWTRIKTGIQGNKRLKKLNLLKENFNWWSEIIDSIFVIDSPDLS